MAKLDSSTGNVGELTVRYVSELGGLDNIQVVDACITRLRITLKDLSLIDEEKIKKLGAMGVVKLGDNNLQVIIGPKADSIAQCIKTLKAS